MSTIKRFEDIEAWKTARELTRKVYSVSNSGEFSRDFGLRDQMRRASVSIMSNIAEASARELRAQFYVAHDAQYLTADQLHLLGDLCEKCSSQISRFMDYLKRSNPPKSAASPKTFRRANVEKSRSSDVPTPDSGSPPKAFRRLDVPTFRRSS